MKKTGRKAMTGSFCAFCLLLSLILPMAGCEKKENPTGERGTMQIDFGEAGMIRNGTAYETYQVEEGQKGIVSVRISRQSGRLDLDIYQAGRRNEPEYTGRELDSTSFDVILDAPGEYKVCITAKKYVGDYGISWRTEEK